VLRLLLVVRIMLLHGVGWSIIITILVTVICRIVPSGFLHFFWDCLQAIVFGWW
jgi:hypothetical protein